MARRRDLRTSFVALLATAVLMFQAGAVIQPAALAADPSPSSSAPPNAPVAAAVAGDTVVGYQAAGYRYQVVSSGAGSGFEAVGFDDSAWGTGAAAFGSGGGCSLQSTVATSWAPNTDVLVRRHIALPSGTTGLSIGIAIDNDVRVYWNGVPVGSNNHDFCPSLDSFVYPVANDQLVPGDNVLAVRGIDRGDQSLLDITVRATLPPSVDPLRYLGQGANPHQNNPTGTQAEPVNTYSGNYTNAVTDLALPGRGLPFTFARIYNSLGSGTDGPLGPGWSQPYGALIRPNPDGSVTFVAEDGSSIPYRSDGAGGFVGDASVLSTLAPVAGSGYTLTRRDQIRYGFDATGRLTSESDRNGNSLTFVYTGSDLTSITDTVGRAITLTVNAAHHITSLADPTGRTVTYGYDGSARLVSVTDVRGGITTYGYDAGGRLATITDQSQHALVTNTYDGSGRVIEQVDARGFHSTFAYDAVAGTTTMTDARGGAWVDTYVGPTLVARRDPLGNTTHFAYDGAFNPTSLTDARNNATTMTYDARGNLLTRTAPAPLSFVETFTYNARNDPLTYVDRRGNTTSYTYDAAGNLKTITGPAPISPVTTYNYDPAGTGLVFSTVDPRGKTTTFAYDTQANLASTTTPLGNTTTMTYDGAGRMLTLVDPRGNVAGGDPALYRTSFTYDPAGHVLTTTSPLAHATTNVYDPVGNRTSRTNNHTTSFAYDAANHLAAVVDADLKRTEYAYDQVGNLTSRVDADLHSTTYAYDLANRLTSETRPLGRVWAYEYDANGKVTKIIDPIAAATPSTTDYQSTFTYDALNRLVQKAPFGLTATALTYDANSNRIQMTDAAGSSTYTFDVLNRLATYRRSSRGLDYQYDVVGNLTRRAYTDGTVVDLTYDNDDRMATMASAGLTTAYGYDPAANLLTTTLPTANGYIESRIYDRDGRLTEVKNQKGVTVLSRSTYTLDAVGNRLSMDTTTGTVTYSYDVVDRLTQACYTVTCTAPGDNFRRYTYDPVGNRLTDVRDSGTTTYTYDAADQLTSTAGPGGPVTYAYDLDGRQTAAGTRTFVWAQSDRLASTAQGNTTTTYAYDGDGLRTSAATGSQANKTTLYDWDPNAGLAQLVAERNGSAALVRRYRQGVATVSMDTGGNPFYYHYDGLGSVVNLTSSTGVTQWTYAYLPYGGVRTETKNQNQAPDNVLRFSGQVLDPTGLYQLRARSYDPGTGRFISTDPAAGGPTHPYVSAYAYVNGNPVRSTDPSGRCPMTAAFVFLFGGLGTLVGPEGTFGGAALGVAAGAALCGAETVAEVNLAKGIIDQKQGQAIPQPAPAPFTVTPYNPNPGPPINPDTGDQEPTGRGCSSVACRAAIGAAAAAVAAGGALMGGTQRAEEGGEPYPISGPPRK